MYWLLQIEHGAGERRSQAMREAFADGSDGEAGGAGRGQPRSGAIFTAVQVPFDYLYMQGDRWMVAALELEQGIMSATVAGAPK